MGIPVNVLGVMAGGAFGALARYLVAVAVQDGFCKRPLPGFR